MLRFLLCFFVIFASANQAHAYVRTMSTSGIPLYWPNPTLSVSLNPTNSSGLSSGQVTTMLQGAFTSWQSAGSRANFSLSTSTSYPASDSHDGINAVFFSSHAGTSLDYGIVAVTQVLYYVSNGQIVEFDMQFNDNDFLFTSNVGDTGQTISGRTAIYLQDVATHEAGHAYGLDHSTVERSTLIYSAFSGQYTLGDDDNTAVRTVYPSSSGTGAITGTVMGTNGGIFGTHVMAINESTGHVQAGTLAGTDGTFRIGDIPAGNYVVMMEPLETSSSTISSYYQNVNHQFCGFSKFRRSFYTSCGSGTATTVAVSSGSSTAIGTLSPSCSQMGNPSGAPTSVGSAKTFSANGGAMFGTLSSTAQSHYYLLHSVSGTLSVRAMSYTLYSPADIKVDILDSSGNAIAGTTSVDNVEAPMPGGYTNYDASAGATGLASGDYLVRVKANSISLSASNYPAGYDMLDSSAHYLLLIGVNGTYGTASTTDMSSCITVNNTLESASISQSSSSSQQQKTGGGCGLTKSVSAGGGDGSGPGSFFSSSLFSLLLVALASKLVQALARKRS